MNKLEIKKEFEAVVAALDAEGKLIKDLWISYLIYLKDIKQITDALNNNTLALQHLCDTLKK